MRVSASVRAPSMPAEPPDRPLPAPRGTTGTPCAVAGRMISATSSVSAGSATASGSPGSEWAVSSRRYDSRSVSSVRRRRSGTRSRRPRGRRSPPDGRRGAAVESGDVSEIDEILDAAAARDSRGEPMALATVVSVRGSSYRRPGARLLVPEEGAPIGLISGGCLESEAARLAREAIGLDVPLLVTIDHSAEGDELWGMGLGCRGVIELLAEPPAMAAETLEALRAARAEGRADVPADRAGRRAAKADSDRGERARRAGGAGGCPRPADAARATRCSTRSCRRCTWSCAARARTPLRWSRRRCGRAGAWTSPIHAARCWSRSASSAPRLLDAEPSRPALRRTRASGRRRRS